MSTRGNTGSRASGMTNHLSYLRTNFLPKKAIETDKHIQLKHVSSMIVEIYD